MTEWSLHLLLFSICLFGFLALALSMIRHQEDLFGQPKKRTFTLCMRAIGWLSLVLAAVLAIYGLDIAVGLVAYSGHTSMAAALIYLFLLLIDRKRKP